MRRIIGEALRACISALLTYVLVCQIFLTASVAARHALEADLGHGGIGAICITAAVVDPSGSPQQEAPPGRERGVDCCAWGCGASPAGPAPLATASVLPLPPGDSAPILAAIADPHRTIASGRPQQARAPPAA